MDLNSVSSDFSPESRAVGPKPKKPSPKVHPLLALLILTSLALAMYRANVGSDGNGYQMGNAVGQWIGSMLFSALFAMIAFWVSKRSVRVFNIVFALVASILVVANALQLAGGSRLRDNKAALAKLQQEIDPIRARVNERMDAADQAGVQAEAAKVTESLNRAADSMKGEPAIAVRVAAEATDFLRQLIGPHTKAFEEFGKLGGVSAEGLTVATANDRLKQLNEMEKAHRHFRSVLATFPKWVEDRFVAYGLSAEKSRQAASSFLSGAKYVPLTRMHEQTAELIVVFRQILQHLRDTSGRWTHDVTSGNLTFDEDAEADQYNQLAEKLTSLAAKEAQFQEAARAR